MQVCVLWTKLCPRKRAPPGELRAPFAGLKAKGHTLTGYYDFNANILFQAIKNKIFMLISHIYLSGICVKFLVILGVNWEYFFFIG